MGRKTLRDGGATARAVAARIESTVSGLKDRPGEACRAHAERLDVTCRFHGHYILNKATALRDSIVEGADGLISMHLEAF